MSPCLAARAVCYYLPREQHRDTFIHLSLSQLIAIYRFFFIRSDYIRCRIAIRSIKTGNGTPLDAAADIPIASPALEEWALRIVKAELLDNGHSNVYI